MNKQPKSPLEGYELVYLDRQRDTTLDPCEQDTSQQALEKVLLRMGIQDGVRLRVLRSVADASRFDVKALAEYADGLQKEARSESEALVLERTSSGRIRVPEVPAPPHRVVL